MAHECEVTAGGLANGVGQLGLFYEVFPMGATENEWFEIALHLPLAGCVPPAEAERREACLVLIDLADWLIRRVPGAASRPLEMPTSYYTLHSDEDGEKPMLTVTLSLLFSGVEGVEQPELLRRFRTELAVAGISAREARPGA